MTAPAGPDSTGLVGDSPALHALRRAIARVAPLDVPVLILGESGTGKELVARALHAQSRRARARFEPVNCGGLTRELLASELFGHERGAFTGAVERRAGLLREADGGTVFLDEVGELAPEVQAMLLRVLGTGEIRPVGGARTLHVDVRVLAATHRDLPAWTAAGRFREDLYYRLRRVVLVVPPLRARLDDLPPLVAHVCREANARYGLAIDGATAEALARLAAHPWPGNIRELEAVVEAAMIERGRGRLRPGDFAFTPGGAAGFGAVTPGGRDVVPDDAGASPDRGAAALQLAAGTGAVTRRALARACGISDDRARLELVALTRLGRLRRIGRGRATRYELA